MLVTNCPPNGTGAGVIVATGAAADPVPVRVMVCGLPETLSAIVSVAGPRAPAAPGVKVRLMTQLELGDTDAPLVQVVVPATIAKSLAFVPLMAGAALRIKFPVPVFMTVTD